MPGPKSDKVWSDAIRKAVHEYHKAKDANGKVKKTRYLNLLASNLVQLAADGDVSALKEVGDRLDGKPHQSATVETEATVHYVAELPAVEETSDEWRNKYAPKTLQ